MNTLRFSQMMLLLALLGALTFPGGAQPESDDDDAFFWAMLGDPIARTLFYLGQSKPGHLKTTEDFMNDADWCFENCDRYLDICSSGYKYDEFGKSERIPGKERSEACRSANRACNCARDNFNMALEVCPVDDLRSQAIIYHNLAMLENYLNNNETAEAYQDMSQALEEAYNIQKEPLSPWIVILGTLCVVILFGRTINRGGRK